jgi:hypothetical protein
MNIGFWIADNAWFYFFGLIPVLISQDMVREEYITHAERHTPRGARRVYIIFAYIIFESFAELKLKFNQPQRLNILHSCAVNL